MDLRRWENSSINESTVYLLGNKKIQFSRKFLFVEEVPKARSYGLGSRGNILSR